MPRLDGTGPMGQDTMSGKGMGNCQGNTNSQKLGVGHGKGKGNGNCNRNGVGNGCSYGISNTRKMSYGKGFGFGAQMSNNNLAPLNQDELSVLKNKANNMENNLNNVKSRILELEQK